MLAARWSILPALVVVVVVVARWCVRGPSGGGVAATV